MDGVWLARMRWRRRGAWLWPAFVGLTLADAIIGHALPPSGETQTLLAAALAAMFLNLIAVVLLTLPVGALIRRVRKDLPMVVARDYAGTLIVATVTAALLLAGLVHRGTVLAHQRAMNDAIARAQAWIGYRAPAEFRRDVERVSVVTIEPGAIYRACVPSIARPRTYCVIVKPSSVAFAGYEPNSTFAQGVK